MTVIYNPKVVELEAQNEWEKALDFLHTAWKSEPRNLNNYLCYALELWYILNYSIGHLKNAKHLDFNELQSKFQSVYTYGNEKFPDNIYFNTYFGYMMYVMPYYLLNKDFTSPDELIILGHEMIEKAYKKSPDDLTVQAFYSLSVYSLSMSEPNSEFKPKPVNSESNLVHVMPIESAIGTYFTNILS